MRQNKQISVLEDRVVEIIATEQKEKRIKKNVDSLRDLWDNINTLRFIL